MHLEFYDRLDRYIIDTLWDQGVNMDDWDFVIIAPADAVTIVQDEDGTVWYETEPYYLDHLLRYGNSHHWYPITWKNTKKAIGVSYHA